MRRPLSSSMRRRPSLPALVLLSSLFLVVHGFSPSTFGRPRHWHGNLLQPPLGAKGRKSLEELREINRLLEEKQAQLSAFKNEPEPEPEPSAAPKSAAEARKEAAEARAVVAAAAAEARAQQRAEAAAAAAEKKAAAARAAEQRKADIARQAGRAQTDAARKKEDIARQAKRAKEMASRKRIEAEQKARQEKAAAAKNKADMAKARAAEKQAKRDAAAAEKQALLEARLEEKRAASAALVEAREARMAAFQAQKDEKAAKLKAKAAAAAKARADAERDLQRRKASDERDAQRKRDEVKRARLRKERDEQRAKDEQRREAQKAKDAVLQAKKEAERQKEEERAAKRRAEEEARLAAIQAEQEKITAREEQARLLNMKVTLEISQRRQQQQPGAGAEAALPPLTAAELSKELEARKLNGPLGSLTAAQLAERAALECRLETVGAAPATSPPTPPTPPTTAAAAVPLPATATTTTAPGAPAAATTPKVDPLREKREAAAAAALQKREEAAAAKAKEAEADAEPEKKPTRIPTDPAKAAAERAAAAAPPATTPPPKTTTPPTTTTTKMSMSDRLFEWQRGKFGSSAEPAAPAAQPPPAPTAPTTTPASSSTSSSPSSSSSKDLSAAVAELRELLGTDADEYDVDLEGLASALKERGGKASMDVIVDFLGRTLAQQKVALDDGFLAAAAPAAAPAAGAAKAPFVQSFLEASPYFDQSAVPVNTYKAKAPFVGKVKSVKRIVGPKATGETCDIVIDTKGEIPYWEGQSYGVIPPGTNPKNGKPNSVRLYSIAASRYGDDVSGKQTTLCVRRATYWCPELGAEDPAKKGVCSNYLCDATPGTEVKMTGPSGKVMLLPEDKPETDIITVATGTGIAPYRSFWKRLFVEDTEARANFKGTFWVFLGVANSDALLYDDELQKLAADNDNFKLDYALSREQENKKGGKMYIQDKVEEYADEIFTRLDGGAHIYFCGLKGMMPGIQDMLEEVCKGKGLDYAEWQKGLKKNGQWHVEVY